MMPTAVDFIADAELREVAAAMVDFAVVLNRRLDTLERDRDELRERVARLEEKQRGRKKNA